MSKRRAELQAYRLLSECDVTEAPVDLERLAAHVGAMIQYAKYDGDDLSGMVFKYKGRPIIAINENDPPRRKRFTIAHEIGHIVLHQLDQVHVDKNFPVKLRDDISSQAIDPQEIEANAFAAALLMPEYMLKKDVSDLEDEMDCESDESDSFIEQLAEKYEVSTQAMNFRLTNLKLVTLV